MCSGVPSANCEAVRQGAGLEGCVRLRDCLLLEKEGRIGGDIDLWLHLSAPPILFKRG